MIIRALSDRIQSFGQDQKGAVAILCLAGALILVMMGLLLFDSIDAANDKIHIQASADAAAHTQASVMARTMNMTAFANVGKRINVGYVAAYHTAYKWLEWIRNAGIVLTILICGASLIPPLATVLGKLCPHVVMVSAGAFCAWERENQDHKKLAEVVGATFGPEIRAFENYQQYMQDITPYWAWSKGVMSGFENHAPLTVGFPLPGPGQGQMPSASLPIRPESEGKWDNMCEKANTGKTKSADRLMMLGDFILTNALNIVSGPLKRLVTEKLGEAFGGTSEGEAGTGEELIEAEKELGEGETEGGSGSSEGGSEEDFDCDMMDDLVKSSGDTIKYQSKKECDEDDEDCVPRDQKIIFDWEEVPLDVNCLPIDDEMKEVILEAAGLLKKDCTDFLKNAQLKGGYYGSIFVSGLLALTINFEDMDLGFLGTLLKSAVPTFHESCEDLSSSYMSEFSNDGRAWLLDSGSSSEWLERSSALIFAYRPGANRNRVMRENYDKIGAAVNPDVLAQKSHGVWGMSRGEITWQGKNGGPNLWESKWGARVRPVALENEWNQGRTMAEVARSVEDVMLKVLQTVHIADPGMAGRGRYDALGMLLMSDDLREDIATGYGAFGAEHMQGMSK